MFSESALDTGIINSFHFKIFGPPVSKAGVKPAYSTAI
ncbi:hypothetical protein C4J83_2873 [Pseudomonas sp. LBUM920]|nr:hypothetical protein C4J83_2873 [Pseudomonas sp. LBUM920]